MGIIKVRIPPANERRKKEKFDNSLAQSLSIHIPDGILSAVKMLSVVVLCCCCCCHYIVGYTMTTTTINIRILLTLFADICITQKFASKLTFIHY